MFGFGNKKKQELADSSPSPQPVTEDAGLFARLKRGLSKTSNTLTEGMSALVLGKKKVDDEVLEELEMRLLTADVGVDATRADAAVSRAPWQHGLPRRRAGARARAAARP